MHKPVYTIFGGTFDPPHLGHLIPLMETADLLGLSDIALLLSHIPALKSKVTPTEHRVAMTRLLCKLDARLSLDLSEVERGETSYTINTLKFLRQQKPRHKILFIMGIDSLKSLHLWQEWESLFDYCHILVMARPALDELAPPPKMDTHTSLNNKLASKLYNFYTTQQQFDNLVGRKIDEKVRLTLMSKLAQTESDGQSMHHASFMDIISKSAKGNLWFVKNQHCGVSSSLLRKRLNTGKNVQEWVPNSIIQYINKHQLYKQPH